jgi:hypothetical protein
VLQRYKLRLGVGTVLTVDQDGLRTWLTDERATVQVAGTQEWRPLRQFLADEESAARLARALVPPEPRPTKPLSPPEIPAPPVELSIGRPPMVQALADEPSASGAPAPPWREPDGSADEAPVIRLKPLDDGPPVPETEWAEDVGDAGEDEGGHDRLEGPLLHVLTAFAALLGRCLDPLTPLVRRWPSASAGAPARPGASVRQSPGRRQPEVKKPPAPAAERPLDAPRPVSELPVLRLAEVPEAFEAGDVYEGEPGQRFLPTLLHWTVRIVLLGGLVAGGALAALNWRTWFPRAAEVGQTMFNEIDRQARAGQKAREQEQALRGAVEQLPHLAPATLRLVLSANESRVLEPPEVFQLAEEAADRGQSALTAAEAAELRTLQRELLDHLRPPERARLAEYDRARASRVVFPFENPPALELVARGARALPARGRERLQQLLGKAVAAGLGVPTAAESSSARPR